MAGASQVTIQIDLIGYTFSGGNFPVDFYMDNVYIDTVNFAPALPNTASAVMNVTVSAGTHTFHIEIPIATINYLNEPFIVPQLGTYKLTFNDNPPTTSGNTNLIGIGNGDTAVGDAISLTIACIHGASLIETKNGLKRIDTLTTMDEVVSGDHLDCYAKILSITQCWISHPGPEHDAIIFEPGSLGENEPFERFIIDPCHPMGTKKDYLEDGIVTLKPAGAYLEESDEIYTRKWSEPLVQNEPSLRYDLILEEPYSVYVANGMVIKSNNTHRAYRGLV